MWVMKKMSFYENLFVDIVLILFPIFIYLLYVAYSNNIEKSKNEFFFDFINLSSFYILYRYKIYFEDSIYLLFLNIPLILSYLKKRNITSLILSLLLILYTNYIYGFSIFWLFIEYIIYFTIYCFFYIKKKDYENYLFLFLFIKGFILSFEAFYILPSTLNNYVIIIRVFLILLLFYAITSLVVTLLKKGEEILSLNQVLKELEQSKRIGSSLFRITHEIKNPLAVCKGYLDMMDYKDGEKVKKYNNIIKEEIERSLSIVDDFSDYTKIKINLDIMDINMLLEDTTSSMKSLLLTKNIQLKNNIKDDEKYIYGDYNRLKQVFVNVIKNSIEAINDNNGIIEINEKELINNIIITIKDNGCGMDKETLEKCGETFFTTKPHGTGLGVGLSKEIIKLHNGKIEYESKKNIGTKVTITLQKAKI